MADFGIYHTYNMEKQEGAYRISETTSKGKYQVLIHHVKRYCHFFLLQDIM